MEFFNKFSDVEIRKLYIDFLKTELKPKTRDELIKIISHSKMYDRIKIHFEEKKLREPKPEKPKVERHKKKVRIQIYPLDGILRFD
jgi:hypothetical protein